MGRYCRRKAREREREGRRGEEAVTEITDPIYCEMKRKGVEKEKGEERSKSRWSAAMKGRRGRRDEGQEKRERSRSRGGEGLSSRCTGATLGGGGGG